jgi:hypothetical protein
MLSSKNNRPLTCEDFAVPYRSNNSATSSLTLRTFQILRICSSFAEEHHSIGERPGNLSWAKSKTLSGEFSCSKP